MPDQPLPAESKSKGSSRRGCLIGCLIVAIVVVVAAVIGGYLIYKKVTGFADEFVKAGYTKKMGQSISVSTNLEGDYLYICQNLEFDGNLTGNIALLCQTTTITSYISGNVDAKCQVLKFTENSHVAGNVNIICQMVEIRGNIDGNISGTCQTMIAPETMKERISALCRSITYIPESEPTNTIDEPDTSTPIGRGI